ncbi:hypothetical protein QE152_g32244 [Popillia japonica]|uniref:Uncharacterized protein n=1 Tax=Popillia japonica TaxID=7064 RepID=A0AAW1J0E8_POPJA
MRAQEETFFVFERDVAPEFEDLASPQEPQFIESRSEYDQDYEHEDCVPQERDSSIDIENKTRAVEFWRSGKAK